MEITGLKLKIVEEEHKNNVLTVFIIAFALFSSMAGAFFNFAELNGLPEVLTAGFIILALEYIAIRFVKFKRAFLITNIILVGLMLTAILIFRNIILDGVKLICNQLFIISEKYQAYKYIRFTVNSPSEDYEMLTMTAALIIAAMIAVFVIITVKRKNIIMYAVICIMFTGVQIYFGIFSSSVWNIAFYVSLTAAVIFGGGRSILNIRGEPALFLTVLAVVCALIYFNYHGADPVLSELSENIRDQFDEKLEIPSNPKNQHGDVNMPEQIQDDIQVRENLAGSDGSSNNSEKYKVEFEENFSGSRIGVVVSQGLLFVLVIIFIVILVFSARLLLTVMKAAKRRKEFDSPDCAFAVNLMFNYLMQFLAAFGLKPDNINGSGKNIFSFYASQLEYIISPQYSKEYLEISEMWLETAYSEHETTSEIRKKMRLFLDKTPSLLSKNVKLLTRIKIKVYWLCK